MKHLFAMTVLVLVLAACGHPVEGGIVFRSADPALGLFVPVAEAEVGEIDPVPPLEPPCEMVVKGNISIRTGEKIYHTPGQANYESVKINEAAGEMWFCSEQEAIDAGWRKARN